MMTLRTYAVRIGASSFVAVFLAVGTGPGVAGAAGTVSSGTATQVGVAPSPGENGRGQLRLSGKLPGGGTDLRLCTFTIDDVLVDEAGPTPTPLPTPTPVPIPPEELVLDRNLEVPPFVGTAMQPKRGGKATEVTFETASSSRPSLNVRVSDKGRGSLEFVLTVDRAVIESPSAPFPTPLTTAFSVDCPSKVFVFDNSATWRATDGTNIRTP
jgi:hypothetical protein